MKIAIVTDTPFLYEDTMYLNELEKRLPANDIYPKVFVVRGSALFEKVDSTTGIMRMINTSRLAKELANFDLIHVQFTFPIGFALAFLSFLKFIKRPIVVHSHGYDVFTVPSINYGLRRNSIGRFLTQFTWKKVDHIIAVSKKSEAAIVNAGINERKVSLLYNGIDEQLFKKSNPVLSHDISSIREESDFILLSVASVVPVKNHERLLKAFSILSERQRSRRRIKLLLIGNRPRYYSVNLSSHDDVIYVGKKPHNDLPAYYNMADAFILPSLSEAHPWSLLEAMSCQLPAIASDVGGISETLGSQFLFDPYNTDSIIKKIEYMVGMDTTEREREGISNRQKVLKSFTLEKHIAALRKIFETTLQS